MTMTRLKTVLATSSLAFATGAFAQYKYAGPDGRITYSDRPPPPSAKVLNEKKPVDTAGSAPALPYELQQAVTKYPVTLYSGNRCAPCDDARAYLRSRGVPFAEKMVTTDDDIALFKQQSPDGTAPVVSVGTRKSVGFSQPALSALLDSAGYPSSSVLPPTYQPPAPTPLAPTSRAAAPVASGPARNAPAPPAAPPPAAGNAPPGFRF
jgi:glutaredoxin